MILNNSELSTGLVYTRHGSAQSQGLPCSASFEKSHSLKGWLRLRVRTSVTIPTLGIEFDEAVLNLVVLYSVQKVGYDSFTELQNRFPHPWSARGYPKLPILFGNHYYFRTIPHSLGCSCPNFSTQCYQTYFSARERNTAGHETSSPSAFRAGPRSYVKLLRGRSEEPGNEAK